MSDCPSVRDAMSVRLGLQRCNGAPGCPCQSSSASTTSRSSSLPSPPPLPLGSRTRSSHGTASGTSSSHHSSPSPPASQEGSDSAVPEGFPVQEWSGLERVAIGKCNHGRRAVLKKCSEGKHSGRRFLGCPLEDEQDQCQFKEWVEAPWPERVQTCLKGLWKELKTTRRCEATANASLIQALQVKEVATKANANLVNKVNRTKQVAHDVCKYYHIKASVAVQQKNKLLNLTYILCGVIAFLVSVIVYLAK